MNKNIPATSFMNLFREIVYNKDENPKPILDIWDAYMINQYNKKDMRLFQLHEVSTNDTWVSLARLYYGEERLWWVIPMFNDIEDPFASLNTELQQLGVTSLQILKSTYIDQLILAARQQKIINDRITNSTTEEGL